MKNTLLSCLLIASVALAGCSHTPAIKTETIQPTKITQYDGKILALGDSLTEGYGVDQSDSYPPQLEAFLQKNGYNYHVINSGISGETTTGLSERLDWVLSQNPDIIILTSGANDAMRGIDLEITKQNLETVIQSIKAKDIELIFSGMEIYANLGPEYVADFKNLYPQLAEKHQLHFIPFFLEGVAGDPTLNNADQIHPNKDGYKIIVEKNIWPILEPILNSKN